MNDSLDNLFAGDTGPVRTAPVRTNAVSYATAEERFSEPCSKCRGRGRFISYRGRDCGPCFTCNGAGRSTFKTSPEARAQRRASAADRRERNAEENLTSYAERLPDVASWLERASGRGFNFATSMLDAIRKYGDLTDRQIATVRDMMAKDEAREAARVERTVNAPAADTAGVDRLMAAFDAARAATAAKGVPGLNLRNPRITVGGMTLSPAKATSANPGAIYAKAGDQYLGKIVDGRFFASRECLPEQRDQVLSFIADPEAAAKAYGQETGVCCICNRTLRSDWRLKGIGPICADRYGWA